MLAAFITSCSVIIHQSFYAENVYINVGGSTVALLVLVAALVALAIAAVVVAVRAFHR